MQIEKHCNENWESMKIGLTFRLCDNCNKSVMDFTSMERKDILQYLILNFDNHICGRIYPSQLDYSHDELLIVISEVSRKTRSLNLPFYFLTIGTLIISGCNQNDTSHNTIRSMEPRQSDSVKFRNVSVHLSPVDVPQYEVQPIIGDIQIVNPEIEPAKFAEVMPEFIGGIDSLTCYIQKDLRYPEYEKTKNIEGRIIASFIVTKNGEIKGARIVKSVDSSKNFEHEALRIINNMPKWKAGRTNGKPIDMEFYLPISFELR